MNDNPSPKTISKEGNEMHRYSQLDLIGKKSVGKRVRITLLNGRTIEGTLSEFGQYEISVTQLVPLHSYIVMKAGILLVEFL